MTGLIGEITTQSIQITVQLLLASFMLVLVFHLIFSRSLCTLMLRIGKKPLWGAYVPVYQHYLLATLVDGVRFGRKNVDKALRMILPVLQLLMLAGFVFQWWIGAIFFVLVGVCLFGIYERMLRLTYRRKRTGMAAVAAFVPGASAFVLRGLSRRDRVRL